MEQEKIQYSNEYSSFSGAFLAKIKGTDDYVFARSCKHCTDTADSFNRYVSTYCHVKNEHIAIAGPIAYDVKKKTKFNFDGATNRLSECHNCEFYEKKRRKK